MADGDKQLLQRIDNNCKLLYAGYSERVEYKVEVVYHRGACEHFGKLKSFKGDCECPVSHEDRVKSIRRPALLEQLQAFAQHRDTDRNAKAERQAPRVKKVKTMPELGGFFAYDEIVTDVYAKVDRWLEEAGRDRTWANQKVKYVLMGLSLQVGHFAGELPELARLVDSTCSTWVDSARSTLMITVGDSMFQSVTCGNCGGGLATPWGNRGESDVRCVGSPSQSPCGHTYPMSEWISLYEDHKRRAGGS